jgi:hypothetical protein
MFLVYPQERDRKKRRMAIEEIAPSGRHVRLELASIPFGFRGSADRER